MIFAWSRTIGDLRADGAEVRAHCSRCSRTDAVDLAAAEAALGPLFTYWNKRPPCPTGCGDEIMYIAVRPDAGVWPTHMREADQVQVDLIEAAWRADRLNADLGGRLALQLMVGVIRQLGRYSLFTNEECRVLMRDAVATLPAERQDDASWLLQHYLNVGQAREGWL